MTVLMTGVMIMSIISNLQRTVNMPLNTILSLLLLKTYNPTEWSTKYLGHKTKYKFYYNYCKITVIKNEFNGK
jgi:hypothetical protein